MAYVVPTPADLKLQFPEFAAVPDSRVSFWLDRAARSVDESWPEEDFTYARMLLAAHFMTMSGLGTSAEATSVNDGSAQFRSMRIGSLSLERFGPGGSSGGAFQFSTTRYGREFRLLLRQVKGGPRVAGTLSLSRGDGDNFGPWTQ